MRRLLYIVMTAGVLLAGASSACSRDEDEFRLPASKPDTDIVPGSGSDTIPGTNPDTVPNPAFVPSGTWKMTYDSYKVMVGYAGCRNLTKDVIISVNANSVCIRGMYLDYPDGVLNGTIKGHKLILEPNQKMCDDKKGDPVYFICGEAHWSFGHGHTFYYDDISFNNISTVSFIISDDGKSMTVEDAYDGRKAFWYSDKPDENTGFNSGCTYSYDEDGNFITSDYGTGFPDVDFKVNVKFEKIDEE